MFWRKFCSGLNSQCSWTQHISSFCRSCLRYILFPFTLCTLNVPIVISVAFSSLLGLSLKMVLIIIILRFLNIFILAIHYLITAKFFPFIYSMLLCFFMELVYLICIAALPDRCGVRFCSIRMPFLINFSLGWILFVVLF